MREGWIGVDFDGTLVKTTPWDGIGGGRIGDPIDPMIARVQEWLDEGRAVRIVTARVARGFDPHGEFYLQIANWCMEMFGQLLPITSEKDPHMIVLWDDRCVQVVRNTGKTPEEFGRPQYTRLPAVGEKD